MIAAFCRFWIRRDLKTWRQLRRECMQHLPKVDRKLEGVAGISELLGGGATSGSSGSHVTGGGGKAAK